MLMSLNASLHYDRYLTTEGSSLNFNSNKRGSIKQEKCNFQKSAMSFVLNILKADASFDTGFDVEGSFGLLPSKIMSQQNTSTLVN